MYLLFTISIFFYELQLNIKLIIHHFPETIIINPSSLIFNFDLFPLFFFLVIFVIKVSIINPQSHC